MKILEITKPYVLLVLNPTIEEKATYDVVKCETDAIVKMNNYKDALAAIQKMAYLSKDKVIFNWVINRVEKHNVRLVGPGKQYLKSVRGMWTSTGLFLERLVNDFGYNIIDNVVNEKTWNGETVTMERMSHFVLEEGKHPHDYPYHSVITVPLNYEYFIWLYEHLRQKDKLPGGWGKTQECLQYLNNFVDWKYNPIMWCKTQKKRVGGVHRSWMAPRLGRDSIEVQIMRCWWRVDKNNPGEFLPFDESLLLYDWNKK